MIYLERFTVNMIVSHWKLIINFWYFLWCRRFLQKCFWKVTLNHFQSFYLLQCHTNNLQLKEIVLPKVHYSLEHLAQFVMGATNNFCTWVQHCLVLLLVWVTWRDTNSCKQQSNQCPICYYGPLTWTYVATSFTLCQASAWGHESPRKGPIFWGRKMKREKVVTATTKRGMVG